MKTKIQKAITAACIELFGQDISIELSRPDEQFGDYSTNVALQLSKQLEKNPREIAEALATRIQSDLTELISHVDVAGPGFLNLTLTDQALLSLREVKPQQTLAGRNVVAEYSDPNPFKVLHAGHLYTSVVGDSIANLLETAGATVHRVNFGGDVGLHVGKTLWAILRELGGENPEKLQEIEEQKRSEWMASCYVTGTNAYEDDVPAQVEIVSLNKRVYQIHAEEDHESALAQIYWTCRQWSYDYFDAFYETIGSRFEKYYPESSVSELGLQTVKAHQDDGIFEASDGAVIFRGEPYGLHTRVFVNRDGIPTYEAKDVGLIMQKWEDYHFDRSIVITGNEQEQYMAVVLKAIEQFNPELIAATTHLTHGIVKLKGGVKMSSRKGNILRAVDVLEVARDANRQLTGKDDQDTVLGAVKYAFLKNRLGGDIVYDPEESVSIEGNSGPYLQYAHARARSILSKSPAANEAILDLEDQERSLLRKITEYPEVLDKAIAELMPHLVSTYLYELAQTFNRFYEHNRVIDDPRQNNRIQLVEWYATVLKDGLRILGIVAPEQM